MLNRYYRGLLANDSNEHLLSFIDPMGRAGYLATEHGSLWHVHRHPD